MKYAITSGLTALLLMACHVQASPQSAAQDRSMKLTFNSDDAAQNWRVINDGVMGGRSSGGPRFEDGLMIFEGVLNTNGGGFSSIRTDVTPGEFTQAQALKLRVKSDGRAYKVTLRTNAAHRFRPVSFQINIPQTPIGEWTEVDVPLGAVKASLFGRPLRGIEFDKAQIKELGFIIADGNDGPFHLEIDWITHI